MQERQAMSSTRRRLLAASCLYLALWALTQFVGTPLVRTAVAQKHMPLEDCPRLKECTSRAVAVAPLLVKVEYLWDSGTLAGEGANVLCGWFGRWTVEVF